MATKAQHDPAHLPLPNFLKEMREQVFSKIKNELRRRELRTIPESEQAFGECLDGITPNESRTFFEHSGYVRCTPGRN
ncbi:MAG: hypothetical protein ACRC7O_19015 [Fimbriiglobus sp.]